VAGSHSWLESARSEARALELMHIPAWVESEGPRFRVVVGRFSTYDDADRARLRYSRNGHDFQIIAR
jgi:cell division protein FtsN